MTFQEKWNQMRQDSTKPEAQLLEEFIPWTEEFTDPANDVDKAFDAWRLLDVAERQKRLRAALAGEFITMDAHSQLELGFLFAMFQMLNHRRCFICTTLSLNQATVRRCIQYIRSLEPIDIPSFGPLVGGAGRQLNDCRGCDICLSDYFHLMASYQKNQELFNSLVQSMFLLEADISLYDNRLMAFDRGIPRASGMVYKSSGVTPESWNKSKDIMDTTGSLAATNVLLGGSASHFSELPAEEINTLLKKNLKKPLAASPKHPYSAFVFKTSQERVSAVVNDIAKCQGNAIIVCYNSDLTQALNEELRKNGMNCTITARINDVPTYFQMGANVQEGKRVLIFRGLPSMLTLPLQPVCDGALFIAEHFLAPSMHEKIFSTVKQVLNETQRPRLYFSLEDNIFSIYENEAQFQKLFNIIQFTEKYDPWKQIRRVLAKAMMSKLHKIRMNCLNEEMPLFIASLSTSNTTSGYATESATEAKKKTSIKMEALCFCGSGKPFKDCHGKKRA